MELRQEALKSYDLLETPDEERANTTEPPPPEPSRAVSILVGVLNITLSIVALYGFMIAVKLIGEGFTLWFACSSGKAFGFADSPIAGLMVGCVTTAFLHSSGTVTSVIVALVGADAMNVRQAVFVVMGANLGTCVTSSMVAYGHVRDCNAHQRAASAALVHYMYNLWSIIVFFPIEVLLRPLERLSTYLSDVTISGGDFSSPIDAIVGPFTKLIVDVDAEHVIQRLADGKHNCASGEFVVNSGMFANSNWTNSEVGVFTVALGFTLLVTAMICLIAMLTKLFMGPTRRLVVNLLGFNGYVNILIGTIITFIVHSSTVVTSSLTVMAGISVVPLNQVYALVVGANLGTCGTALLAAMVLGEKNGIVIAMVHFWFNFFGILLFYPIPLSRVPLLRCTTASAYFVSSLPMLGAVFLFAIFYLIPAVALVLQLMCSSTSTSVAVVGWIIVVTLGVALACFTVWFFTDGGQEGWHFYVDCKRAERQEQSDARKQRNDDHAFACCMSIS